MNRLLPLAALLAAALGISAHAQYRDPLAIPHVGTRAFASHPDQTLPVDKPYDQLSYLQKKIVRGWYENLAADDEPPYPVKGIGPMIAELSAIQRHAHVAGRFFAAAHVDAKGHAATVSIYSIPDKRLNDVMAYVLISTRYKPALCKGKPCAMDFPIEVNFE